jgi:hypothetical protein
MREALRTRTRLAAGIALVAALSAPAAARADDPEAARAAYDRGAAAFEAKRYAEAANDLARADALAPNPVALASALKATELADDAVLGMTLADRAELRAGAGEAVVAAARRVREKFQARTGKLSIRCAAVRGCAVTVDAEPFPVEQQRWVKAGAHALEISAGGAVGRYTVVIEGGKTVDWQEPGGPPPAAEPPPPEPPKPAPEPPKPAPEAPPPPRGVSPGWFFASLGVTAVLGGITVWSGVDTLSKHKDFDAGRIEGSVGQAAQTRTNVLIGVTGAAAAATLAVGVFGVRWSSAPAKAQSAVDLRLAPGPGGAVLLGRF